MNNVSLIGRLTADPELKHTQSGTAFTRFSIAVDRNFVKQGEERQADFINIVAWQQRAEFICRYFSKGNRIAINGQIRTGSYTDKDGNKRSSFEIWVDSVEFCESKNSGNSASAKPVDSNNGNNGNNSEEFVDMPNDDDLPF